MWLHDGEGPFLDGAGRGAPCRGGPRRGNCIATAPLTAKPHYSPSLALSCAELESSRDPDRGDERQEEGLADELS